MERRPLMPSRKIFNFGRTPSEKNISSKHKKMPKNHFKTNLFLAATSSSRSDDVTLLACYLVRSLIFSLKFIYPLAK